MSASSHRPEQGSPWYRYFWPWFIVLLLGTAVSGSLTTVFIAFTHQDPLVRDDWYEQGRAINRRLEQIENARRLGVVATFELAEGSRDLLIELEGSELGDVAGLQLEISHPTLAERDQRVRLLRTQDGRYRGRLSAPLAGRWYATLEPLPAGEASEQALPWRLSETLQLPFSGPIVLGRPRARPVGNPATPRAAG